MKILNLFDPHQKEVNLNKFNPLDYDLIVFGGDYFDSFQYSNWNVIKRNFENLINFKEKNNNVIMLLGNHDNAYGYLNDSNNEIKKRLQCSGFQEENKFKINYLLQQNQKHFDFVYNIDNLIFSHAGLDKRLFNFFKEREVSINEINDYKWCKELFYLDKSSGGKDPYGGIFWARPNNIELIDGYIQIAGHTAQWNEKPLYHYDNNNNLLIVCDCYHFVELDTDNIENYKLYKYK